MSLPSQMYWRHQWESRNKITQTGTDNSSDTQKSNRQFAPIVEMSTGFFLIGTVLRFRFMDRINHLQERIRNQKVEIQKLRDDLIDLQKSKIDTNTEKFRVIERQINEKRVTIEADEEVMLAALGYNFINAANGSNIDINHVDFGSPLFIRTDTAGKVDINHLSILDKAATRVPLTGALPAGQALQPGNTDVWTILLGTYSTWFFIPAQYKLQFNVIYSFTPLTNHIDNQESTSELYINTTSQTLNIRTSIWAIIAGSAIGGALGSLARDIQEKGAISGLDIQNVVLNMAIATILGIAAVIFAARKSETQSFISIEDFWGGALIGFLIGYSGTAAFQNFTDVSTQG